MPDRRRRTDVYFGMPWLVLREAIAHNESTSIETGERDRVFYRSGWAAPHVEGITARYSVAGRATIRIPLPERRGYDLVLRLDPVTPTAPESVDVLFNRHLIGACAHGTRNGSDRTDCGCVRRSSTPAATRSSSSRRA